LTNQPTIENEAQLKLSEKNIIRSTKISDTSIAVTACRIFSLGLRFIKEIAE